MRDAAVLLYMNIKDNTRICSSSDRNLARSGIWLCQIGILIWPSQTPDLAKLLFSLARFRIWLKFV